MNKSELPTKVCPSCGRRFAWRKKWRNSWDDVKYCSAGCRSRNVGQLDAALEDAILSLLSRRATGATICPSEAARQVWADTGGDQPAADTDGWRDLMEPTRRAARRLVEAERVQIVQNGRVVDPSTFRGPIRIRLTQPGSRSNP